MANLVKMWRGDHIVDVHPKEVENYRKGGYSPMDGKKPAKLKAAPSEPRPEPKDAPVVSMTAEEVGDLGTDSAEQFSDAQLRDAIKEATGVMPGPNTSRGKLVDRFNELNAVSDAVWE